MSASNHASGASGAGGDRLLDLLCDRATCGLSEAERAEFEALCAEFPELNDGSIERAAAAADVAISRGGVERMPDHLRTKILLDGQRIVSGQGASGASRRAPERTPTSVRASGARRSDPMRIGGWLAAAAAIVVAAIGWMRPGGTGVAPDTTPPVAIRPASEVRAQLLASAPDAVVIPLADWDNPEQAGVTGDVVWSESEQAGYLRLAGLKRNDPTVEQYQLWIVDSRGMGQRISGALFDATPDPVTGEVVVRIEPRIATQGAAAFALTIEKPGGVWVSDMTRRVVIGAKG